MSETEVDSFRNNLDSSSSPNSSNSNCDDDVVSELLPGVLAGVFVVVSWLVLAGGRAAAGPGCLVGGF